MNPLPEPEALLEVRQLRIELPHGRQRLPIVEDVAFTVGAGETVALVGESGCGKSLTALAVTRLIPEHLGARISGRVQWDGQSVLEMPLRALRRLRGRQVAYVFQEPAAALNPVLRVGAQIAEGLPPGRRGSRRHAELVELLQRVGLPDPARRLRAYPHMLSGGMQQRAMLAAALASRPRLLVADEPTTALDVTTQARIFELLAAVQKAEHMAILLITHNLALVAQTAPRMYVMYAGRIVEAGATAEVLRRPRHPYTRGLLDALPPVAGSPRRLHGIEGTVPPPSRWPAGCKFHPRCARAQDDCRVTEPALDERAPGHRVRCHYPLPEAGS